MCHFARKQVDLLRQADTSAPINSRLNVVVRSTISFGLGRNGCWPSRGSQLPRTLPSNYFVAVLPPERPQKGSTQLFSKLVACLLLSPAFFMPVFVSSFSSFLDVYAPLFPLLRRMVGPTPFLLPFFPPPEISSFFRTSIAINPFGSQEVLLTLVGKKSLIGSSLPISSPSMTPTYLLFSMTPLAVAPPLKSPLLPPPSPFLSHGRCFGTWVLIIYQFFYLSLSLRSFAPTSFPLPTIFRKLAGMTLLLTLTLTVHLQRNTRLFLFPLLLLSSLLSH